MEAEIRALLQESGVGFKTNGKSFICSCPRCGKAQKLYIRRQDGRFVCWHCREIDGFHGKAEYALSELCSLPLHEVRKQLYGDESTRPAVMYLDLDLGDFAEEDEYIDLPQQAVLKSIPWPLGMVDIDHPLAARGVQYLEKRGITLDIAKLYGIRYNPIQQRVVFPLESRGNLYGYQERIIDGDKPYWNAIQQRVVKPIKAFTSTDAPRDRVLMFADRLQGSKHCILTEGPIDAMKAHLCGGNVATLGAAVTKAQLDLIRNSGVSKIYMGLDPDAWEEVNRLRKELVDLTVYDLRPPAPFKDLGEMSMEQVYQLFQQAPVLHPNDLVLYVKNFYGA